MARLELVTFMTHLLGADPVLSMPFTGIILINPHNPPSRWAELVSPFFKARLVTCSRLHSL